MTSSLQKLMDIKRMLNRTFYEREEEVEGLLLALLARQHMLLIGPAGTAKSALSTELMTYINGAEYFQWLLTPFSTPEELFGPLSLKELEDGVYRRNTAAKMPEAHLVFLDEIFKANSAILNSLLTLVNERLFYNGETPSDVPLMSVIGASNEFPENGEGLDALYDRFLLRYQIDYIEDDSNFFSMMKEEKQQEDISSMQLEEILELQEMVARIAIPDAIFEALVFIRRELQDEGIHPSDRRFKQSLGLLKAKALLDGRETVEENDLAVLEHVFWETPDQKEIVSSIMLRHAQHPSVRTAATIAQEAEEIYDGAVRDTTVEAGMEATKKLNALYLELRGLKGGRSGEAEELASLTGTLDSMLQEVERSRMDPGYGEVQPDENETDGTDGVFFRM